MGWPIVGQTVAVAGGGIVGLATALALEERGLSVLVLEAEEKIAAHQTGHNSGVVHSGLYYRPGTRKAANCVAGRRALYGFCADHGVAYDRCGKLVVATTAADLPRLDDLEARGRANGLAGLERLGPEGIRRREPHARGVEGIWVPETGIVDYRAVARAMAEELVRRGGQVRTRCRVRGLSHVNQGLVVDTDRGPVRAGFLVNCAGLQSDRLARKCGVEPGLRIAPFLGEYFALRPQRRHLVRNLLYPVPDPRFPFLGVHFTRRLDGGVDVGPNALPAFHRGGYGRGRWSARDAADLVTYGGYWRLVARYWRTGVVEIYRSLSRRAMARALRRIVPAVQARDLVPAGTGIRAQALTPDGALVDDFRIAEGEASLHVLNAPSPAATASLSIGADLAQLVADRLQAGGSVAGGSPSVPASAPTYEAGPAIRRTPQPRSGRSSRDAMRR